MSGLITWECIAECDHLAPAVYRGALMGALAEIERLRGQVESERIAREKSSNALRDKDQAMGVLFDRLHAAGVDCSDLMS